MEDDGILQPYKTHKEKSNEMISQETMKRVAAYISLMMERWQDMDVIYAPYHIQ